MQILKRLGWTQVVALGGDSRQKWEGRVDMRQGGHRGHGEIPLNGTGSSMQGKEPTCEPPCASSASHVSLQGHAQSPGSLLIPCCDGGVGGSPRDLESLRPIEDRKGHKLDQ